MDTTNLAAKIDMLDKINLLNFEDKMEAEQSPGKDLRP